MANILKIITTVIATTMWVKISWKITPSPDSKKNLILALTLLAALAAGYTASVPLQIILPIVTYAILQYVFYKRRGPMPIIESGFSYVVTQLLSLLSIVPVQLLFSLAGNPNATEYINAVRIIPWIGIWFYAVKLIQRRDVPGFCHKYALALDGLFFFLFCLSYIIVKRPYTQQNREIGIYAVIVSTAMFAALILWTKIDQTRHNEHQKLAAEIERLVDEAHRYKESVPAVERALTELKQKVASGAYLSETAAEIETALHSVTAMRRRMEQRSQADLLSTAKVPDTGLVLLNSQLQNEVERAASLGITFVVEVFDKADILVRGCHIAEDQIMQILGDLYRNAESAVLASTRELRQILLTMGYTEQGYMFCMSDTGIPFPEDKLAHIGELKPTADGHGHGLAHIAAVLEQYGGELNVVKHTPEDCYTKDLSIIFEN